MDRTQDLVAAIQGAYERDQAQLRPAVAESDVPASYDAFTPEWLSTFMCRDVPGARVVDFALSERDDGSTNRRKLTFDYNAAGRDAGLPKTAFCKSSHSLLSRMNLGLCGAAHGEKIFYTKVRSSFDIDAPRAYHANYDPASFASNVILEDLSDQIEGFGTHETPIDFDRAADMVSLMATYHSAGETLLRDKPELHADLPTFGGFWQRIVDLVYMKETSNTGFLAAEKVIPARLFARFEEVWPATMRAVGAHAALRSTFVHNDVHLRNWYVRGGRKMGLMDWQLGSIGNWSRDFAYGVACALQPEDRRRWERDLLQLYIAERAARGSEIIAFDTGLHLYRQQLLPALAFWTNTLCPSERQPQDMQPSDAAIEFIRRMATAIDDHDVLDLDRTVPRAA